jgi:uracil phosphoribosyltransferase
VSRDLVSAKGEVIIIDHPLIRVKLTEMRDTSTVSQEFRARLTEVATLMVYEVTRTLETQIRPVQTPLALCDGAILKKPLVIAPILRAGLGMVEGILWLLPDVSVAHIGMYRNEETRRPESYYFKAPSNLAGADVLLVDPMLATGWSATAAITQLKEKGARHIRFVCLVTCPAGIDQLHTAHPEVPIYTAAVDSHLDDRAYIVPGLGDAGDRYFGTTPL